MELSQSLAAEELKTIAMLANILRFNSIVFNSFISSNMRNLNLLVDRQAHRGTMKGKRCAWHICATCIFSEALLSALGTTKPQINFAVNAKRCNFAAA